MKKLNFTGCFIVGSDVLSEFWEHTSCYGSNYVFIGGKRSMASVKDQICASFADHDCRHEWIKAGSLATFAEIDRIMSMDSVRNAEVICGVGGGSALDIARTAANRLGKALVMIATTVAADAACSSVSVYYSEDGSHVVGDAVFHKCPDMVIVDSKVISQAPARHLAAGMGDGLATWYEAMTNYNNPKRNDITETGIALSDLARKLILEYGPDAYTSVQNRIVTSALEKVIEANAFLSGTGGANTGCSAAHGIGDFLTGVQDCHQFMHGERVFVGLMIQLILENYPKEEIMKLMRFGIRVGLPVCLEDLGIQDVAETAYEMAKALQTDHFMVNLNCDYSVDILTGAMLLAGTYKKEM